VRRERRRNRHARGAGAGLVDEARRGAARKDGHSATVYFAAQPQYLLEPLPAAGKFACRVTQTINGKRLDGKGTFLTREEALRGGLEELRTALGW
jgi:hypothetical protein